MHTPAAPVVIARAGRESIQFVAGDPDSGQEPTLLRSYGDWTSPNAELTRNDFRMTRGLPPWGILVADELRDESQPRFLVYRGRAAAFRGAPEAGTIDAVLALRVALALTEVAGRLHTLGVLHLSINPFNVLWSMDPPGDGPPVRLLGFGRAMRSGESEAPRDPADLPKEYWPYMSPEQTGRTGGSPDERSDYYSIGAALYAFFSGAGPFAAGSLEEMLYLILTRPPVPLNETRRDIPPALCAAVMRMMSKDPGDRPQSAREIAADLQGTGAPARHRRLLPPREAFIGRDSLRDRLRSALDRVRSGQSAVVCVTGFSGIGKTALLRASLLPAVARGVFTSGKFEQGSMAPYSAFVQAFDAHLARMLGRPKNEAEAWKEKTAHALRAAAPSLFKVFHGLQALSVSGAPRSARGDEAPAAESKRALQTAVEALVRHWASESAPFVLFLDDLQWADPVSLELCRHLADARISGLLIAVAYRQNEISEGHPLKALIDAIAGRAGREGAIDLGPLRARETRAFIQRLTPGLSPRDQAALRRHVVGLTGGNPLFLLQLVRRLRERRAIYYDFLRGRWRCALPDNRLPEGSPDVIAFLAAMMRELPPDERTVLPAVSFPSSGATAQFVAALTDLGEPRSTRALRRLRQRRLLAATGDGATLRYRPSHDNIRQAACELVPSEERAEYHLRTATVLRELYSPWRSDTDLYEAVEHFNDGAAAIASTALRYEVADLDLQAGVTCKAACSFSSAARYLLAGVSLLPQSCWQERYPLSLALVLECAEAEFLVGELGRMNELIDLVIARARRFLDSARASVLRVQALMAENRLGEASRSAIEVAQRLGVRHLGHRGGFPVGFRWLAARVLVRARSRTWPRGRSLRDPRRLLAMRVMLLGASPTIIIGSESLRALATETALITLRGGLCPYTPVAVALLGMVTLSEHRVEEAYRLGRLATRLQEQVGSSFSRALTETLVNFFIDPWKLHLSEVRPALAKAMESGIRHGEYEQAALAGHFLVAFENLCGMDLRDVDRSAAGIAASIDRLQRTRSMIGVRRHHQFTLNLIRPRITDRPYVFAGPAFDEAEMLPLLEAAEDKSALAMLFTYKAILAYLFDARDAAREYSARADSLLPLVPAQTPVHMVAFYHSLILLDLAISSRRPLSKSAGAAVKVRLRRLRSWAESSPVNFRHRADLVEAELLSVRGSPRAERRYLQAVSAAEESRYTQDAALAHQRTALFYERQGDPGRFRAHLVEARRFYQAWGALAVVRHLERSYPWLPQAPPPPDLLVPPPAAAEPPTPRVDIDVETLMSAGRVISSEIEIDAVVEQVIRIIMKCAGATRGVLQIEEDGVLTASLEGTATEEGITVSRQDPGAAARLDSPIATYVRQARQPFVGPEGPEASPPDPLERRPRSVLCAPILHRGKLDGILYLENTLTAGVFTRERLKVVELLAAQAAVSLENAAVYRLQEKVAGQTEKLLKAEKLASLGVLTAGVAHEVNNPAHVIRLNAAALSSSLQSLRAAMEDGVGPGPANVLTARMAAALQEVHDAVGRIESIVGELKAYVGGGAPASPVTVDLNQVVRSVLQISEALIRRSTRRLEVHLAPDLRTVSGDFGRLQQMVRNLVENACQALTVPEHGITIRTANSDDGRRVELSVADEGRGIRCEDLPHVTEPLFSTRRGEGGTGLGLSIVAAVVKEHGGELSIDSREGGGTRASIRLPVAPGGGGFTITAEPP